MNKDRLEKELKGKLEGFRMDPPAGMWDRIASTLSSGTAAAESGDSVHEGAAAPKQVGAEHPYTPARMSIRRPRKLRFRFATAAAILLCAVVIGYRYSGFEDIIVAKNDPAVDIPAVDGKQAIQIAITGDSTDTGIVGKEPGNDIRNKVRSMITNPDTPTSSGVAGSAVMALAETTTLHGQGSEPVSEVGEIGDGMDVAGEEIGSDTPEIIPFELFSNRNTRPQNEEYDEYNENPSDIRSNGVPADWSRPMAEDEVGGRRAAPMEFSLYSSNMGSLTGASTIAGTHLSSSDFSVYGGAPTEEDSRGNHRLPATLKHRMPLSFGINASVGIFGDFSVESGITYSYLFSESHTSGGAKYKTKQKLNYIGIPVTIKLDILNGGRVDLYGSAGIMFEMCVSGVRINEGPGTEYDERRRLGVRGIQPSVGFNMGAEYKISNTLGLYLEPGMSYYFENARQPESYRTENPLNLSLKAGFRIKFN